ncbi:hypothetical protein [Glycocaulis sp.]|uniref:hypothetical protein n=1 Tax=Glycocaulis sp. TaxID=1969725 RepID=UPI003D19F471
MLSMVIDILHWVAGAVLALVGIGYDRAEDCAPAVRQHSFDEARFVDDAAAFHFHTADVRVEQVRTPHGEVMIVVHTGAVQEVSGCAAAPARLPSAPPPPVLRL